MTEAPAPNSPLRGRLILGGLFALFFLPILTAWVLNVGQPDWLSFGKTNHGNLIEPAARFEESMLAAVDGRPIGEGLLKGKWTIVYIEPSACLVECDHAVFRMRQSRYAMGKDMDRVQRLVVLPKSSVEQAADKLLAYDPGLNVVAAEPRWLDQWRPGKGEAELYIVDPQGFLIMWYRADAEPGGLIKDLKRLLKISKIG